MDKEIVNIGRKLRLVKSATAKGDPKLYKAAKAAQDAVYAERKKYTETVRNMSATVEEEKKRLDEVFGAKTDFSISNFENNYDKFNQEEKEMITHKMQLEFNNRG